MRKEPDEDGASSCDPDTEIMDDGLRHVGCKCICANLALLLEAFAGGPRCLSWDVGQWCLQLVH